VRIAQGNTLRSLRAQHASLDEHATELAGAVNGWASLR
jgi:hypothetical protein